MPLCHYKHFFTRKVCLFFIHKEDGNIFENGLHRLRIKSGDKTIKTGYTESTCQRQERFSTKTIKH